MSWRGRQLSDFAPCKHCGATVRWVTMRESRKRCPVNPEPDRERGVIVIMGDLAVRLDDGRAASVREKGGNLYSVHWSTCPAADAERRAKKIARMGDREFLESLGITVEKL